MKTSTDSKAVADDLVQLALAEANKAPPPLDDLLRELADALARKDAEIVRLTQCLSVANSQTEDFERKFYLESDRAERAEARITELRESALGGYEDGWHKLRNERDDLRERLANAEARVREARAVFLSGADIGAWNLPDTWGGKRVALVLLDTEEEK